MKEIIKQLEENFYEELDNPYIDQRKAVKFNGGCVYIDEYNENDNTFTVTVLHDNRNESPNVEEYLSKALAERIDIAEYIYERDLRNEKEWESIDETNRSLCLQNGWPVTF